MLGGGIAARKIEFEKNMAKKRQAYKSHLKT
jgi:hypothetical protein